ncbi:MAG: DUF4974 domain-containing protein [Odoribacteraceae bacterium]|jgi:ferric-dicitrate binding protein FerR (iron transport regulator)|nr:DUF4974 domain-containing protein [Odoribacteraceae bacterium]
MTKRDLQQLHDFLSGKEEFDASAFAREVNARPALGRFLSGLAKLPGEASAPDRERVIRGVKQALRRRQRQRLLRTRAAAAIAALLLAWAGWRFAGPPAEVEMAARETPVDSSRVRLLLGGGEVLSIHRLDDTTIHQRGADITWERDGLLTYAARGQADGEEPAYNTLVVPRGNEFRLSLADRTEVWLNSETEMRYPVEFPGRDRVVHVTGEAFFKVARDTLRPFVVLAGEMRVEALGTSFNVNTYRDQDALLTTLVEGTVRVTGGNPGEAVTLRPGQQARLRDGQLTVRQVNTAETVAWINGQFLYYDMPLEQIARQLERWYNVAIYFQDDALRSYTFTGVVKRYHSLREICSYIEETTNVRFVIDKEHVTACRAK